MSDLERKVPDQKRATDSADRKRLFELLLKGGGIYLAPEPCIPRADDALRCVLSAAQKRLLLAEDAPPFAVPPNEVVTLRFKGPLSPAALSQALDEFVRRHEILRTLFLRTGSDIQQQVLTHTPRGIPILDAVGTRGFSNAAASRLTQEIAQAHIDINAPPLIRGRLITIQPHEAVLVLSLKAVACDSWSRRILITELGSFYSTYLLGGESGYKEPAIQYRDFAEWQQARLAAGDMDEQIEYWIDKLRDQARRDGPASFRTIPRKAVLELMLEKDLSNRIRLLCRAEGVTPFI
ncbi:MAG TPA: condensation domain-containing protein, partial [Blastocatellia bacterium]|nr:condensation domain-containing protein [Blastocatellia bacterium]